MKCVSAEATRYVLRMKLESDAKIKGHRGGGGLDHPMISHMDDWVVSVKHPSAAMVTLPINNTMSCSGKLTDPSHITCSQTDKERGSVGQRMAAQRGQPDRRTMVNQPEVQGLLGRISQTKLHMYFCFCEC